MAAILSTNQKNQIFILRSLDDMRRFGLQFPDGHIVRAGVGQGIGLAIINGRSRAPAWIQYAERMAVFEFGRVLE